MEKSAHKKNSTLSSESKTAIGMSKTRHSESSSTGLKYSEISTSTLKESPPQFNELDNTNFREQITNLFLDLFLESILIEKNQKHRDLDNSWSSLSEANQMSIKSNVFVLESFHTIESDRTLNNTGNKSIRDSCPNSDLDSHKTSQAEHDGSSSKENSSRISCSSSCPCTWRIVFGNGNIYEGQINGTLMHGKGIFYWSDGSVYKGNFKDAFPCGQGKLLLTDMSTYEGEFCTGFFHGYGTLTIKSTPLLYRGEWKFNQRNGNGWLLYNNNNWYEGDWTDNRRHGFGIRQYSNGAKYKGSWMNNTISGDGCILWSNNDYYTGEWSNGYQHGYGEYTWCIVAHNSFVFCNYNHYKGNWAEGKRNGAGIMNFGHESGAKLAGTWQDNVKDGPGIMICGNGLVVQKNPLFVDDKPSFFEKHPTESGLISSLQLTDDFLSKSMSQTFRKISSQVETKDNLQQLNQESIINITKSGSSIKENQYIKLLGKNTGNSPPLKIPIHNITQEVDLNYFIQNIQYGAIVAKDYDMSSTEINYMVNSKSTNIALSPSTINYMPSNYDLSPVHSIQGSASQQCFPDSNELRNLIVNHLTELRDIYKRYSTICATQELNFEPVLIRLFLWQLYRDIGVTDNEGVSIVEIDEALASNPNNCFDTVHGPWEPIYFWQFLQSLVGVALMLYINTHKLDFTPTSGFTYHMFKSFLENKLFPNAGIFKGNCLTNLKDLIPIKAAYRLFKEIGEPHSVEEFLKNTYLRKNQKIPCYDTISSKYQDNYAVKTGTNITILSNDLFFLAQNQKSYERQTGSKQKSLYTFSQLGKKQIISTLAKVCPGIVTSNNRTQMAYRLSFIEFLETVLLLSYEKVEKERLKLLEELRAPSCVELTNEREKSREMSKISQHSAKRKKSKKFN